MIPLIRDCHQGREVDKGLHDIPSSHFTIRPSLLLTHPFLCPTLAPSMPVFSVACKNPTTALSPAYALRVILPEHVLLTRMAVQLLHTKAKDFTNPPCLS